MDADIVSLEEIENSVALGETDRDDALSYLVDALNADAGGTRWAYAPSPAAADLPPVSQQDVIRTAFIYDPATVAPGRPLEGARRCPRRSATPASRSPRPSSPAARPTPRRSA